MTIGYHVGNADIRPQKWVVWLKGNVKKINAYYDNLFFICPSKRVSFIGNHRNSIYNAAAAAAAATAAKSL